MELACPTARAGSVAGQPVRCYLPPEGIPEMIEQCADGPWAGRRVLQRLESFARFLGFFSLPVMALLIAAPAPAPASSASEDYAEQALETLLNQPNLHPRAFFEDHKIRIYFTNS